MSKKGNELKYLEMVLNKESWSSTGGNWVNTFEKMFAEKMGMKYGIAFNSGTSALHIACLATTSTLNSIVVQPPLTVIMNTFATLLANFMPIYIDIDKETWCIDTNEIEKNLKNLKEHLNVKILMPVSLYGIHSNMEHIMKMAKENNLFVIEDNAQCPDKSIADCAMYSLEASKHLNCGEGGILTTNDKEFAKKVRKLGGIGYKNLEAEEGRVRLNQDIFQNPNYQRHDTIGYNYRMTEFQAAIGVAQLERYDELINMRKLSGKMYLETIKDCEYLVPQKVPEGQEHFYWTFPVLFTYSGNKSWEDFRKAFINNGGKGVYAAWVPPYRELIFEKLGWDSVKVLAPVTEYVQPRIMQFRTNAKTEQEAEESAKALKKTIEDFI